MKESEIRTIIYQNTSTDYYRGNVRGIWETSKKLHEMTNLSEDDISLILHHELSANHYRGNVMGIDDAVKKIMKLLNK